MKNVPEQEPEPMVIARWLFGINLAPAIIASVVLITVIFNMVDSYRFVLVLLFGISCEWLYYKQTMDIDWAIKKSGWVYSIIVNVAFTIPYIVVIKNYDLKMIGWFDFMIIYPLFFLAASIKALIACKRMEKETDAVEELDPETGQ